MAKKNRKTKKKKNRNNGSSSGSNIRNTTIPNVATIATTTTTTIPRFTAKQLGFSKKQMKKIDERHGLKGYPKSMEFAQGYKYNLEHKPGEAIVSFIRGAKTVGCVACMFVYADIQKGRGNIHLALPFYLEGSLRGHTDSIQALVACYEEEFTHLEPGALVNFWTKIMLELGYTLWLTKEERLANKKIDQSMCANCGKESDYEDMTSKKWCGGCRYYSYCGKDCQREGWTNIEDGGENHMGECRQLKILTRYYRCKVKNIREAIIRGENPKDIVRLQTLRTKLGLNRPKGEYKELLVTLRDDDTLDITNSPNRYEYLTARNDGTVWIGSTPNMI